MTRLSVPGPLAKRGAKGVAVQDDATAPRFANVPPTVRQRLRALADWWLIITAATVAAGYLAWAIGWSAT